MGAGPAYGPFWRDWVAATDSAVRLLVVVNSTPPSAPSVEGAVARAESLARRPGLVAVVELAPSRRSLAAAPVYARAGIPHLVPISTSRRFVRMGFLSYQVAADDSMQGEFIADFAATRVGAGRVGILYQLNEYGRDLRHFTAAALRRRGVVVTSDLPFGPASDLEAHAQLTVDRGDPDAVVMIGYQREVGALARALHGLRPGLPLLAGDGAIQTAAGFTAAAGPASDSVWLVAGRSPDSADAQVQAFRAAFIGATGRSPITTDFLLHDALAMVLAAVREESRSPEGVRRYLDRLGGTRPAFTGFTGPISFGSGRAAPFAMSRLAHGQLAQARATGAP